MIGGVTDGFALVRYNADGSRDTGFGSGGRVITTFDFPVTIYDAAVQSDGKIIVAGRGFTSGVQGSVSELVLSRYRSDGSLDPLFGTKGTVTQIFNSVLETVVAQTDGKILITGGSLLRFNADGSVDSGFGQAGTVSVDFVAVRAVVQADGKIVVMGNTQGSPPPQMLERFNADGTLDTSFGNGGRVSTGAVEYFPSDSLAVQQDGKIIVSGIHTVTSTQFRIVVARLGPDGKPDAGFGTGGIVTSSFPSNSRHTDLALEADMKIVLVASAGMYPLEKFGLERYDSDGSLDTSFGTNGTVTTSFVGTVNSSANDVVVQPDGKILVGGSAMGAADGVLLRYNQDGTLDPSFGTGGRVAVNSNQGFALQKDGRIVVGGTLLKRYNADGRVDTTFTTEFLGTPRAPIIEPDDKIIILTNVGLQRFNADGSLDFNFGVGGTAMDPFFAPAGVAIQPDGKILAVGTGRYVPYPMVRFNADGSLDTSFGSGGEVALADSSASSLAIQSDGKIVIAGSVLERFNADGSPDTAFGTDGQSQIRMGQSYYAPQVKMALLPDSRIVALVGLNPPQLFLYKPTGNPDLTFGTGGQATIDLNAASIAVGADGKVVLAGNMKDNNGLSSFAVARYLSTGGSTLTPNQRFVSQLYLDVQQRSVDPLGLASWSGLLDQGTARAQVVLGIQSSVEQQNKVVKDLYQAVLRRDPDTSGMTTWANFLGKGGKAEDLEAILLGSDEFFAAHGSDNRGFLPALYQLVLNRPIDSTGAQDWGQALQSGKLSRAAVAGSVLGSVESDRLEVQALYRHLLHRNADPDGLNTFVNLLAGAMSKQQVTVLFLTSPEYVTQA